VVDRSAVYASVDVVARWRDPFLSIYKLFAEIAGKSPQLRPRKTCCCHSNNCIECHDCHRDAVEIPEAFAPAGNVFI